MENSPQAAGYHKENFQAAKHTSTVYVNQYLQR